jgi:RNA polymerase sigma-70 factor (ECF subfamily)
LGRLERVTGVKLDSDAARTLPLSPETVVGAVPSFDAFFEANYRDVVGLAATLCGRRHIAEELAQEAFVRAYRRWGRISGFDKPDAWVRRVVVNLAVSSLRRSVAEARALARLRQRRSEVAELATSDGEFWRAVRALPRRQAQCLALRYYEELSIEEIADVLAIDAATVRVHLHHGRHALARGLGITEEEDG